MVSSFDNVFGRATIEACHRERVQKYEVYGIIGQSIEDKHEPPTDEIDYNKSRIPITHKSPRGEHYRWELVPLIYDLYADPTGRADELDAIDGKLFIFKQPPHRLPPEQSVNMRQRRYGIGVDSSTGLGYDFSAICVTEAGDGAIPDVQAAEWRSRWVGHVEVFAFAMAISLYFTNPRQEIFSYPLIGIEQLLSVGDVCQKEMKRLGYPAGRFFNFGRYDGKRLKQPTNKQGWFTTGWSRPILIGNFVHGVKNGWYVPNSPWTIEDCRNFEVHFTASGKKRMEHSSKSNDDAIFASSISTFILHDTDTLANRSKKQFRESPASLPNVDLTPYSGLSFNPKIGKDAMRGDLTIDDIIRERERYGSP
jgi:hypothetical protein